MNFKTNYEILTWKKINHTPAGEKRDIWLRKRKLFKELLNDCFN